MAIGENTAKSSFVGMPPVNQRDATAAGIAKYTAFITLTPSPSDGYQRVNKTDKAISQNR